MYAGHNQTFLVDILHSLAFCCTDVDVWICWLLCLVSEQFQLAMPVTCLASCYKESCTSSYSHLPELLIACETVSSTGWYGDLMLSHAFLLKANLFVTSNSTIIGAAICW